MERTTQDREVKTQVNENKSQSATGGLDGRKTIPEVKGSIANEGVSVTEERLKNVLHLLMKMVKISQNFDPKQWEQIQQNIESKETLDKTVQELENILETYSMSKSYSMAVTSTPSPNPKRQKRMRESNTPPFKHNK